MLFHVVNSNGLKREPSIISDVVNFNTPNNLAELRKVLEMVAYCR